MFIFFSPFYDLLVIGESLKRILSNGVLDKIDKALMFLMKKSASGAVDQAMVGLPFCSD